MKTAKTVINNKFTEVMETKSGMSANSPIDVSCIESSFDNSRYYNIKKKSCQEFFENFSEEFRIDFFGGN